MYYIIAFLVYWLVVFVVCYIETEYAQNYLYDEATPAFGWKVAGGSILLAGLLTYFRPSFDTMFTADIAWTVLQAIVWFGVFTLILQFHPQHALLLGVVTFLILSGITTFGVQSLTEPERATPRAITPQPKPLRKPAGAVPVVPALPKAEGEPAKDAAKTP
jgi:hypothetical protein